MYFLVIRLFHGYDTGNTQHWRTFSKIHILLEVSKSDLDFKSNFHFFLSCSFSENKRFYSCFSPYIGGGNNKIRVLTKGLLVAVTHPLGGYKIVIWLWKNVKDNVTNKISRFHGGYPTAKAPRNRSPVKSRAVGSQGISKKIQVATR